MTFNKLSNNSLSSSDINTKLNDENYTYCLQEAHECIFLCF
jgi:hypothetical protein